MAIVRPNGVYLLDFFLLQYSVLCTVESLSLLYFLFYILIYMFLEMTHYKLGVFHANQASRCVLIHIGTKGEVGAVKPF